ncbi:hypothetical protein ACHOLT_07905 [Desulfitobacterium sp. Sab5]|uniref:hypothetical protein n=1 Tax=Desulfitobacterium nosdiversum TaxID=3375356 RepID=UPI003CE85690
MWPRRKILVLMPCGAQEGLGFKALLDALEIEAVFKEITAEESLDLVSPTIPGVEGTEEESLDCGPTEIVYWPESLHDQYRQWGESRGIMPITVVDFLRGLWEQEIILPVPLNTQQKEQPVLWTLLFEAGYEPSLLWPKEDGQWSVIKGRGLHWVVPETWLNSLLKEEKVGRESRNQLPEGSWTVRKDTVDFYSEPSRFQYIGNLKRYPDAEAEESMYRSILTGLQLGVTWWEVKKNIRWNIDADKRDQRTNRAECVFEDAQYMENRGNSRVGDMAEGF